MWLHEPNMMASACAARARGAHVRLITQGGYGRSNAILALSRLTLSNSFSQHILPIHRPKRNVLKSELAKTAELQEIRRCSRILRYVHGAPRCSTMSHSKWRRENMCDRGPFVSSGPSTLGFFLGTSVLSRAGSLRREIHRDAGCQFCAVTLGVPIPKFTLGARRAEPGPRSLSSAVQRRSASALIRPASPHLSHDDDPRCSSGDMQLVTPVTSPSGRGVHSSAHR